MAGFFRRDFWVPSCFGFLRFLYELVSTFSSIPFSLVFFCSLTFSFIIHVSRIHGLLTFIHLLSSFHNHLLLFTVRLLMVSSSSSIPFPLFFSCPIFQCFVLFSFHNLLLFIFRLFLVSSFLSISFYFFISSAVIHYLALSSFSSLLFVNVWYLFPSVLMSEFPSTHHPIISLSLSFSKLPRHNFEFFFLVLSLLSVNTFSYLSHLCFHSSHIPHFCAEFSG